MAFSYASKELLKSRLGLTDTTDDVALRSALEAASQAVDDYCRRSFQVRSETRYVSRDATGNLFVDDLLAVTTLKSDDAGDRTYSTTWATTDYDLMPVGAGNVRTPYWQISRRTFGNYYFPAYPLGVEIVGKWGYWEDLGAVGTLGAAIVSTSATSATMTAGHSVQTLNTLKVDDEQMYVTAVATNALTIERGVNGSTAATHLNGATVYVYRYPSPVVEATLIEALRLFRRKEAAFGVAGSDATGISFRIAGTDPDYRNLLGPYKLAGVA